MSGQRDTTPGPAVRHALAAVKLLQQQNPALAAEVGKILPGYAKHMEGRGENVSIESLLDAASQGLEYLKSSLRHPVATVDFMAQYKQVTQQLSHFVGILAQTYAELLAAAQDPQLAKKAYQAALPVCASANNTDLVMFCLQSGANQASKDAALHAAAQNGHVDMVTLLLDSGADIYA